MSNLLSSDFEALTRIGIAAHENSDAHGFWDDVEFGQLVQNPYILPAKLMLIVSEAAEALDAFRESPSAARFHLREDGKPEGVASEFADKLIRLTETYERWRQEQSSLGFKEPTIGEITEMKMKFNESRPYKHGKVC